MDLAFSYLDLNQEQAEYLGTIFTNKNKSTFWRRSKNIT